MKSDSMCVNLRPHLLLWIAPRAVLALYLLGCSTDEAWQSAFEVRDSAGIAVATSARPSWDESNRWVVDPEPLLRIGTLEGDDAYTLSGVVGAMLLSDDRVAFANSGTQQIRYYDSRGTHLSSVGRSGAGPGEFQYLARVFRMPGDSVFAVDPIGGRFTVLAPDASIAHIYPADWQWALPHGRLSSGRLVMLRTLGGIPNPGYHRSDVALTLLNIEGTQEDTLGRFPGNEGYMVRLQGGAAIANYIPPFGRALQAFVGSEHIYIGSGDHAEVEVRGADGSVERIIRYGAEPRPVRSEDLEAWRNDLLERATNPVSRPSIEQFVREATVPPTMPFYSALRADSEGNLWIRAFTVPGELPRIWEVFDQEGRWLGKVNLPEGLEVSDIGPDYVLGVYRDELGVESVMMHRLRKQ